MKMSRAVRWRHIRRSIRKNPGRWALLMLAKWVLDREIRAHNLCAMVVRGGCAASFGISSIDWNCDVPGDEMIISVDPICLGSNCSDFRDLHHSDHRIADLVDEMESLESRAQGPANEEFVPCADCGKPCIRFFRTGSLCDGCAVPF
jgi:hypothetical protein